MLVCTGDITEAGSEDGEDYETEAGETEIGDPESGAETMMTVRGSPEAESPESDSSEYSSEESTSSEETGTPTTMSGLCGLSDRLVRIICSRYFNGCYIMPICLKLGILVSGGTI